LKQRPYELEDLDVGDNRNGGFLNQESTAALQGKTVRSNPRVDTGRRVSAQLSSFEGWRQGYDEIARAMKEPGIEHKSKPNEDIHALARQMRSSL